MLAITFAGCTGKLSSKSSDSAVDARLAGDVGQHATLDLNHDGAQRDGPRSLPDDVDVLDEARPQPDPNGFIPAPEHLQPVIDPGETCRAGYTCHERAPCEQTLGPEDGWAAIDWSKGVICFTPGDYTAHGLLEIGSSGRPGAYKQLRCQNEARPWIPSAERCRLEAIELWGKSYWIIERFSIYGKSKRVRIKGDREDETKTTHVVVNENHITGFCCQSGNAITFKRVEEVYVQHNVVEGWVGVQVDTTPAAIGIGGGSVDSAMTNNEMINIAGARTFPGRGEDGVAIVNNDLYATPAAYTDCEGTFTPTGQCSMLENAMGGKADSVEHPGRPYLMANNRVWGRKHIDLKVAGDGGGSPAEGLGAGGGNYSATDVLFIDNIVEGGDVGITVQVGKEGGDGVDRISIIRNTLLFQHGSPMSTTAGTGIHVWVRSTMRASNIEYYLNTVIGAQGYEDEDKGGWIKPTGNTTNQDLRCNTVIDSVLRGAHWGQGFEASDNVYYGAEDAGEAKRISRVLRTRQAATEYARGEIVRTSVDPKADCTRITDAACFLYEVIYAGRSAGGDVAYCTSLGCEVRDGELRLRAIRGPKVVYRKLLTVDGGEPWVLPYLVADNSAPDYQSCPPDFAARKGIGVDDRLSF